MDIKSIVGIIEKAGLTDDQKKRVEEALRNAAGKPGLNPWLKSALSVLLSMVLGFSGGYAVSHQVEPPAPSVEGISIAPEFTGKSMELVALSAETTGSMVRWRAIDDGILIVPGKDTHHPFCVACEEKSYRIEAWTAINGSPTEIVRTVVTIGKKPMPPPPPEPKPIPPKPIPPKPNPVDPWTAKFQAAYDAGTASKSKKAAQLGLLVALYGEMAKHTVATKPKKKDGDATEYVVTTTGDMLTDYRTAAAALLMPDALVDVRKLVAAEVALAFGTESAPLDASMRAKAVSLWERLAKALGEVRP